VMRGGAAEWTEVPTLPRLRSLPFPFGRLRKDFSLINRHI
jgi:hypothetical protein